MIRHAAIHTALLRPAFKPYIEQELRALGVPLPDPWPPSDDQRARLAEAVGRAAAVMETETALEMEDDA